MKEMKEIIERGEKQARDYFGVVKLAIVDVEYRCEHNVVFPDFIEIPKSKLDDLEYIAMQVQEEAQIDYNDWAELEVNSVEFEEVE